MKKGIHVRLEQEKFEYIKRIAIKHDWAITKVAIKLLNEAIELGLMSEKKSQ